MRKTRHTNLSHLRGGGSHHGWRQGGVRGGTSGAGGRSFEAVGGVLPHKGVVHLQSVHHPLVQLHQLSVFPENGIVSTNDRRAPSNGGMYMDHSPRISMRQGHHGNQDGEPGSGAQTTVQMTGSLLPRHLSHD